MHFVRAAVNCGLVVLSFPVLNTGPRPVVLGAGRAIPFWRMHVANLVSAVRVAGVTTRAAPPRRRFPPPHLASAAWNCAWVTPAGSRGPAPPA
ncbi:MAG: hypothetical protein QOE44_1620, partial [Solirubrobacteraceae bacterium]|nr:hypothetical protein [Solirubrobacteraceae bacterium]